MNESVATLILSDLMQAANPAKVPTYQRFFKTGIGEYGEGDQFLGIAVPVQKSIAKHYQKQASLDDCAILIESPWHECRSVALALLVGMFDSTKDNVNRKVIIDFYESHFERVNNWDLVDMSAPKLTGPWYLDQNRSKLFDWAQSSHLWTRRIAIMSTFAFIRAKDFATTLELADILLLDTHDLMQKASGWMLREVGNRDGNVERTWLAASPANGGSPRYLQMGRTMLRYAIEKFPKAEYQMWLKGLI